MTTAVPSRVSPVLVRAAVRSLIGVTCATLLLAIGGLQELSEFGWVDPD